MNLLIYNLYAATKVALCAYIGIQRCVQTICEKWPRVSLLVFGAYYILYNDKTNVIQCEAKLRKLITEEIYTYETSTLSNNVKNTDIWMSSKITYYPERDKSKKLTECLYRDRLCYVKGSIGLQIKVVYFFTKLNKIIVIDIKN